MKGTHGALGALILIAAAPVAWAQNPPAQPDNTGPLHGFITTADPTAATSGPTLSSSAFFDADGQTHSTSQWQVSTDFTFATIGYDTGFIGDLRSHVIDSSTFGGSLSDLTTNYWRVRYQDSNGDISPYSAATRFRYNSGALTWTGGMDTDWGLNCNWSPPTLPAAGDDVIIQTVTNDPIVDANRSVAHMYITASIVDLNGFTLTVNGGFAMASTLVMTGGTLQVAEDFATGAGTVIDDATPGTIDFNGSVDQDVLSEIPLFAMPGVVASGFSFTEVIFNTRFSVPSLDVNDDRSVFILDDMTVFGNVTINHDLVIKVKTLSVQGTLTGNVGSTLELIDGAILDMELGGAVTVQGDFITSGPLKPRVLSSVMPPFSLVIDNSGSTATVDFNGLVVENLDGSGMVLAISPTVLAFDNVDFLNGTPGGAFLDADVGMTINNVMFDGSTLYNIQTPAPFAGTIDVASGGGAGFGEPFENDNNLGVVTPGTIVWPPLVGAPFLQIADPIGISTAGGTSVLLNGFDLNSATEIRLGAAYPTVDATVTSFTVIDNASLEFSAPSLGAGQKFVEVVTPSGTDEIRNAITYSGSTATVSNSIDGGTSVNDYRMKSLPIFATAEDFLNQLKDCFGPYDPKEWRAFAFDANTQQYAEMPALVTAKPNASMAGKGVFLISKTTKNCDFTGLSTDPASNFYILLEPSWNMVALPSTGTVGWSTVRVGKKGKGSSGSDDVPADQPNVFISEILYAWDGVAYMSASSLVGGDAFWVYNKTSERAVLFASDPAPKAGEEGGQILKPLPEGAIAPPLPPGGSQTRSAGFSGGGGGGGGDFAVQAAGGSPGHWLVPLLLGLVTAGLLRRRVRARRS